MTTILMQRVSTSGGWKMAVFLSAVIGCPSYALCEEAPGQSAAKARAETLFPRLLSRSEATMADSGKVDALIEEMKKIPTDVRDEVPSLDWLRDREALIADKTIEEREVVIPDELRVKLTRLVAAVESALASNRPDGNNRLQDRAIVSTSSDDLPLTFTICDAASVCQAVWLSDIVIASRRHDAACVLEKVDVLVKLSQFLRRCGDDIITCYTISTAYEDAAREAATLAQKPWCTDSIREKLNALFSDDRLISDAFEASVRNWFQTSFLSTLARAESLATPAGETDLRSSVLRILRKMDNNDPELVKRARQCKLLDLDATIRRAAEYASCFLADGNGFKNDGTAARVFAALTRDGDKGWMLERAISDSSKTIEFKSPADVVAAGHNLVGIRVINLSLHDLGMVRGQVFRAQQHVNQYRLTIVRRLYRSKYGREPMRWNDLISAKLVGAPFRDPVSGGETPLNADAPHR